MLTPQSVVDDTLTELGIPIVEPPNELIYYSPADFISQEMYIPEIKAPLDLHPEQAAVLNAMSERIGDLFKYTNWLFSMPKKSAKTFIGAGVALWQAWRIPNGEIYIIGNDQKQADNRMAEAIRFCVSHNERMKRRVKVTSSKYTMKLDNGTRIESIPVDPKGEAGMNPTGLFWTEAWGAMGKAAELLWSEATLSPTRQGQSFKFVESYAGYRNESLILERLYDGIVRDGTPHPTIPELYTRGQSIAYWCTRRYLSWQQDPAYYAQQALEKTPQEFARQHNNQWSDAQEAFVPIQWWDDCTRQFEPMRDKQPCIMALDAAVESDCFALVIITTRQENGVRIPQVRYFRAWRPPQGGQISFAEVEAEIMRLYGMYSVIEVAYDPYMLADMAQRHKQRVLWKPFQQGTPRLVADKMLYDLIRDRRIEHNGDVTLREHMSNADRKPEDEDKLRIIKRSPSGKIDGVVAVSMGVARALYYQI